MKVIGLVFPKEKAEAKATDKKKKAGEKAEAKATASPTAEEVTGAEDDGDNRQPPA